ncbi:hypothetical protein [Vibrio vulnificus]|uniref:hypothetical protein n=1 Tax=Vibrio vulnificus TaxID=672 RepID=UPI00307D2F62
MEVSGANAVASGVDLKMWLETAYYIAGIVVAIVAIFGLSQLRLLRIQLNIAKQDIDTTKKIAKTNSQRAAVELAVNENRRFAETCIQTSVKIRKYCKRNDITYLNDVKVETSDESFSLDLTSIDIESTKKLSEIEEYINELLNGLEAYALYFLGGVADEKMGFLSNSKQYIASCEMAFKFFPLADVSDEDLKAVKQLYFKWKKMHKEKDLRIKQKEIQNELKKHTEKYTNVIGG